ncbi:MAG: hypothetical protein AAF957_18430 [Planctomycetota bacterium]
MTSLQVNALLGTVCLVALVIAALLAARRRETEWKSLPPVRIGGASLSAAALYKISAVLAFVLLPTAAMGTATFKLLEGTHETPACASCHVMQPMVTDLHDPTSPTLAALHARNGWISKRECYTCHTGYGFAGGMAAKLSGYRHLVRYTTGTYEEPIRARTGFDQSSCLACHARTAAFAAVNSHVICISRMVTNEVRCTSCHGPAHPSREDRTPGSPVYDRLMAGVGRDG